MKKRVARLDDSLFEIRVISVTTHKDDSYVRLLNADDSCQFSPTHFRHHHIGQQYVNCARVISDDVPDAYKVAVEFWGMTQVGNFEGSNILNVPNEPDVVAKRLKISESELEEKLAKIKDRLYATRTSRIAPALDDKILTAWNGMMLASLAEAGRVLKRDDYLAAAERAGDRAAVRCRRRASETCSTRRAGDRARPIPRLRRAGP